MLRLYVQILPSLCPDSSVSVTSSEYSRCVENMSRSSLSWFIAASGTFICGLFIVLGGPEMTPRSKINQPVYDETDILRVFQLNLAKPFYSSITNRV